MNEKEMNVLMDKFIGGLSDEQKAQIETCNSLQEVIDLAKSWEGCELPDELLSALSGGTVPYRYNPNGYVKPL